VSIDGHGNMPGVPVPKRRISPTRHGPAHPLPRRARVQARVAARVGLHPAELAGLLHELSVRLLGAEDCTEALEHLAALAAGAVRGTLRCSVTLIGEGGPLLRAGHGPAGETCDEQQYATGAGPALDAARTRALVTVADLATDARWPELAAPARADRVRAVVAVPLDVPRSDVGSLSLYLDRPGDPGPDLLLTAMALASQAEVLLGELRRREVQTPDATVDRAIGVIIAQRGCGVREAYEVLGETAQRLGLDHRAVADRLITAVAARNA
jgi:hypothetical protein